MTAVTPVVGTISPAPASTNHRSPNRLIARLPCRPPPAARRHRFVRLRRDDLGVRFPGLLDALLKSLLY
ncbi:hypothetical protein AB0D27_42020 [Streptomyces sp. NPDC048415]|uniref:hypothetical protein n=1 Tax=Streptomyces sp. NPDC048415 TaxID=3154822 RepID=UPI0034403902